MDAIEKKVCPLPFLLHLLRIHSPPDPPLPTFWWLGNGQYLRALVMSIYMDPAEPSNVIETYTFNFTYPLLEDGTAVPVLEVSSSVRDLKLVRLFSHFLFLVLVDRSWGRLTKVVFWGRWV